MPWSLELNEILKILISEYTTKKNSFKFLLQKEELNLTFDQVI
jgi:hypothetical protein